jgi:hypothetical protein
VQCFAIIGVGGLGMYNQIAQNSGNEKQTKETVIKNLIESKNYVFTAKYVQPLSGPIRHLTSE